VSAIGSNLHETTPSELAGRGCGTGRSLAGAQGLLQARRTWTDRGKIHALRAPPRTGDLLIVACRRTAAKDTLFFLEFGVLKAEVNGARLLETPGMRSEAFISLEAGRGVPRADNSGGLALKGVEVFGAVALRIEKAVLGVVDSTEVVLEAMENAVLGVTDKKAGEREEASLDMLGLGVTTTLAIGVGGCGA